MACTVHLLPDGVCACLQCWALDAGMQHQLLQPWQPHQALQHLSSGQVTANQLQAHKALLQEPVCSQWLWRLQLVPCVLGWVYLHGLGTKLLLLFICRLARVLLLLLRRPLQAFQYWLPHWARQAALQHQGVQLWELAQQLQ